MFGWNYLQDYCLLLAYELLYLWNALGACLKHSHASIQIGKSAENLWSFVDWKIYLVGRIEISSMLSITFFKAVIFFFLSIVKQYVILKFLVIITSKKFCILSKLSNHLNCKSCFALFFLLSLITIFLIVLLAFHTFLVSN